jgi:transcriptional regulator with XRE-family HTH domain
MMPKITLKAARVNAGLTQEETAHRLGRTKQTIVNWETGVTEIKYRDLCALSEMYEMPIEYIRLPERQRKGKS